MEIKKNRLIGKNVEMFNMDWYCKVIDVDEYGWTFEIVKPYQSANQVGDILFYSHSCQLTLRLVD